MSEEVCIWHFLSITIVRYYRIRSCFISIDMTFVDILNFNAMGISRFRDFHNNTSKTVHNEVDVQITPSIQINFIELIHGRNCLLVGDVLMPRDWTAYLAH